jgi:phospholipid transport system substrate-binding protein
MTRTGWIRRSAVVLAAVAMLAAPSFADEPQQSTSQQQPAEREQPQEIVRATVDQVIEILGKEDLSDEQRVREIEEITYERFDFPTISRLVVARKWKEFTPAQRGEFVAQFKLLLSSNYGSRITRYEQQKVAILRQRVEKNGDVTVLTRIEGGSADGIKVDYRLRRKDRSDEGPWLVIDVVIEGVSLVSSYRSQFTEVVNRGGPSELLKQLREKNAEKAAAAG